VRGRIGLLLTITWKLGQTYAQSLLNFDRSQAHFRRTSPSASPLCLQNLDANPVLLQELGRKPSSPSRSRTQAHSSFKVSDANPVLLQESDANPLLLQESDANPVLLQESDANPVLLQESDANPVLLQDLGRKPSSVRAQRNSMRKPRSCKTLEHEPTSPMGLPRRISSIECCTDQMNPSKSPAKGLKQLVTQLILFLCGTPLP
jgi:hypothetical protein